MKAKIVWEKNLERTPLECMECDRKFSRKIGPRTFEVKCPRCGSTDILVTGFLPAYQNIERSS